jgi:hypothetical protein
MAYGRIYRDRCDALDRSLLIAGTARSGTTWLAEIVAAELGGRIVFEPFHSELVREFAGFHYFHYMRPDQDDSSLEAFSRRVFSGRLRDPWADRYVETLRPRARVVKEIRGNLMLRWLSLRFPEVPQVFVLRHPCAVVASRLSLGWATDTDLSALLAQKDLVADFLAPHLSVIESASRPEEKHALIWCVSNLVPLCQFPPGELPVFFYEDLCREPKAEFARLFRSLGREMPGGFGGQTERASMTSRPGAGPTARRIDGWRQQLTASQIDAVLRIVQAFSLGHLYGSEPEPLTDGRALPAGDDA